MPRIVFARLKVKEQEQTLAGTGGITGNTGDPGDPEDKGKEKPISVSGCTATTIVLKCFYEPLSTPPGSDDT